VARKAECIFCQIVSGEAPSFRVCEDERTLTFLDLFPVSTGHTLVITKDHAENVFEATSEDLAAVARTARRVAQAIRLTLAPDGLGVFQLNGAAAGQTVFHYHMHLVPRAMGDGLTLHGRRRGDESELREMAKRLSAALDAEDA
jgi:histidine triad (HIT) family protein